MLLVGIQQYMTLACLLWWVQVLFLEVLIISFPPHICPVLQTLSRPEHLNIHSGVSSILHTRGIYLPFFSCRNGISACWPTCCTHCRSILTSASAKYTECKWLVLGWQSWWCYGSSVWESSSGCSWVPWTAHGPEAKSQARGPCTGQELNIHKKTKEKQRSTGSEKGRMKERSQVFCTNWIWFILNESESQMTWEMRREERPTEIAWLKNRGQKDEIRQNGLRNWANRLRWTSQQRDTEREKKKNRQTIKELPIACAPDLSLKSIKTFIMTRRHRFNLIQVDDTLFISWNDSSDPSGAEKHIEFNWPTCVV